MSIITTLVMGKNYRVGYRVSNCVVRRSRSAKLFE
jgi:hypothetical protein